MRGKSLNRKAVIVTGELSGETHGAHLVAAITALCPIEFSGIGSRVLRDAGVRIIYDYKNISIIGISEVFSKLGHIRQAYGVLKEHLLKETPQLLILVDFPGFNLLLVARLAKKLNIPVVYFIPPQIWAWREGRVRQIKANVSLVLSILPFEEAFYRRHGVPVTYVGHPYTRIVHPVHAKEQFYAMWDVDPALPVITVMPGSRKSEVERHMPVLLKVLDRMDRDVGEYTVLLPVADSLTIDFFHSLHEGTKEHSPHQRDCRTTALLIPTQHSWPREARLWKPPSWVCPRSCSTKHRFSPISSPGS